MPDGIVSHRRGQANTTMAPQSCEFHIGRNGEEQRIVQQLVEWVEVQENALKVRIRADGLVSLVGERRQREERKAA